MSTKRTDLVHALMDTNDLGLHAPLSTHVTDFVHVLMDTNDLVLHTPLPTQVTDIVHALSGHMIYLSTYHCPRRGPT